MDGAWSGPSWREGLLHGARHTVYPEDRRSGGYSTGCTRVVAGGYPGRVPWLGTLLTPSWTRSGMYPYWPRPPDSTSTSLFTSYLGLKEWREGLVNNGRLGHTDER